MRVLKNAERFFISKCGGTLKIYLHVFDKKEKKRSVALNFFMCSRLGVLGTKNLRSEVPKTILAKNQRANLMNCSCSHSVATLY